MPIKKYPAAGAGYNWEQDVNAKSHSLNNLLSQNFTGATELTISAGEITVTQTMHTVDTEADAASDDLDTISGGTQGDTLYLRIANDSREVVIKHGIGNIQTWDGGDYTLQSTQYILHFFYDGSNWLLVDITPAASSVKLYRSGTNQTISSGTRTKVELNGEAYDRLEEGDPSTNYRITVNEAGIYFIQGATKWSQPPTDTKVVNYIEKNGTTDVVKKQLFSGPSGTDYPSFFLSNVVYLTAGDYLELDTVQTSGGAVDVVNGEAATFLLAKRLR